MADDKKPAGGKEAVGSQPIIIKRIKKGGHGHHGGAWKVAYADFVTAMMAFFLLLWLLNVTTDEQKAGIAEYFSPSVPVSHSSGGSGIFGGASPFESANQVAAKDPFGFIVNKPKAADSTKSGEGQEKEKKQPQAPDIDEERAMEVASRIEEEQFQQAENELKQAIQDVPELKDLQDTLLIERTPEGLRIQIVDQDKRSMFPLGSADMYDYTKKLIRLVAKVVEKLPNHIAISGHTDAAPYRPGAAYTNWELSADRANASRRELLAAGVKPERVTRVAGMADREPLDPKDPLSPRNRRITILLMRENNAKAPAPASAPEKPAETHETH